MLLCNYIGQIGPIRLVTELKHLRSRHAAMQPIVLKRTTLFVFPTDGESRSKRTRSNALEQVEVEILILSREAADKSTFVFRKSKNDPYLSMLALCILCVPVTSTPFERVSSTCGFIFRPHRGSLTKDMLANLTFLKCNSPLLL
jgi:hypothetical protein